MSKLGDQIIRNEKASEILISERLYVKQMKNTVQLFIEPLKKAAGQTTQITKKFADSSREEIAIPRVSINYISAIFGNFESILEVHQELLKQLEARLGIWFMNSCLGDIIVQLTPFMKTYIIYVSNFDAALTALDEVAKKTPSFGEFLEKTNRESDENLESFLSLPVKRISQYGKWLEEMVALTPTGHEDLPNLQKAFEETKKISYLVQTSYDLIKNRETIMKIQQKFNGKLETILVPHRTYIRDGQLIKICRKTPKPRQFFLFNDVLVYAQLCPNKKYILSRMLKLVDIRIRDIPDSTTYSNAFEITSPEKSFIVYVANPQEKIDWVSEINEAILKEISRRETLRRESGINMQFAGRGDSGSSSATAEDISGGMITGAITGEAPIWIPDNDAESCMICKAHFNLLKRRHHCRNCGRVVCNPCSNNKIILHNINPDKAVRACDKCYNAIVPEDSEKKPKLRKSPSAKNYNSIKQEDD